MRSVVLIKVICSKECDFYKKYALQKPLVDSVSMLFIEFGTIELTRHNSSRCDERRLLPLKYDIYEGNLQNDRP